MRIPRLDFSQARKPRITAAWVIGAAFLIAVAVTDHAGTKQQSSPTDQALFLRYVDQLDEVHHVLTEHPGTPRWWSWVLGYPNPNEVLKELELAYRGAEAGGFLPKEAGKSPAGRSAVPDSHQHHPSVDRLLRVGLIHFALLALTLPCAAFAVRTLAKARSPRERTRVWVRWRTGPVVAVICWSLLVSQLMAGLPYFAIEFAAPQFAESPWSALVDSLSYLILQGIPVLWCAAAFLPKTRHFTRVLGLGPSLLFRPATLAVGFGLFALDSLSNIALYEVEKLGGQIDTRDFLSATLIDARWPGLLSELFTAAVVAPVCEEILFRGFLFNGLRARMGVWGAAIVSSLIFGGLHDYSWFGMATIALFGMLTCWVFVRTGSLWPGILLHALSNFVITLGTWYAYSEFPSPA